MTDFAIQAEHLNLRLQSGLLTQKQVLQDISFQLPEGAVMGLVGRNGAGKTSLLQCLLGLSLPSTGQSSLLGCSSAALDDATRERLGYVAQTPDLFGWLTGGAHLRELTGIYKHFDERRALELALRLGVPLGMRADKLSLGDQQKLSVVLALGHDPDLLIMDEPVASLDPLARREFMRALFAERRSERPRSILLSSHLLADLERVVTHVMFLREGRVQLVDEWDALVENLRLVKLAEIPASAAVVHSRMVMGTWHVLVDLRRCASSERAAWSQGQVLLMDDLFEELNT